MSYLTTLINQARKRIDKPKDNIKSLDYDILFFEILQDIESYIKYKTNYASEEREEARDLLYRYYYPKLTKTGKADLKRILDRLLNKNLKGGK